MQCQCSPTCQNEIEWEAEPRQLCARRWQGPTLDLVLVQVGRWRLLWFAVRVLVLGGRRSVY